MQPFHGLLGIPDTDGFEHSYFNAVSSSAGLLGILLGLLKFSLGLGIISLIVMAFGVLLSCIYLLSRLKGIYRPMIWPVILLYLGILVAYWMLNGGSDGGTPFYFFVGGLVSLFLAHGGRKKFLVVIIYLAVSAGLLYIDAAYPEWIGQAGSNEVNERYLRVSFIVSQAVLYLMLIIISMNFEEVLKTLGTYHHTFEEDLVLARAVQEQVLNYAPETTAGYDFALVHHASTELSGDMYDLSRPDPTFLRVLLADARGHGINAALISMLIKSEWMNVNSRSLSPGLLMERLNTRIFSRYEDTISLSAFIVDIYFNRCIFASGGHLPQVMAGPDGLEQLDASGPPLGILGNAEYPEREIKFGKDYRLVLFTDALTEELDTDGRAVGSEWFLNLIPGGTSSSQLTERITGELARLKGQTVEKLDCADDLTLIVIGSGES